MHAKVVRSTIDPTSVAIYWFVCLLQPCWGWETGSAFWASGPRGRHCWQGRRGGVAAVSSLRLKATCVMIDCTASPAVPCMWHSLSWPPLGSFFPLHPPCNEALIKTREFPGCLLRHFGVFVFLFLPFLVGCEPQWKGEEGEIKRKAGAKVCSFVFPSLSKSKFRGVW